MAKENALALKAAAAKAAALEERLLREGRTAITCMAAERESPCTFWAGVQTQGIDMGDERRCCCSTCTRERRGAAATVAAERRLIYVGEIADRIGFRCFDPESYTFSTEFELTFDEQSGRKRMNALREHDIRRELQRRGQLEDLPLIQND